MIYISGEGLGVLLWFGVFMVRFIRVGAYLFSEKWEIGEKNERVCC